MAIVTEKHGWPALQKMYEEGQHGALKMLMSWLSSAVEQRAHRGSGLESGWLEDNGAFGGGGWRNDAGPNPTSALSHYLQHQGITSTSTSTYWG